jgi:Fic family protein
LKLNQVPPGSPEAAKVDQANAELLTHRQNLSKTVQGRTGEAAQAAINFQRADALVNQWVKEGTPITEERIKQLNSVIGQDLIAQGSVEKDAEFGLAYGTYRKRKVVERVSNESFIYPSPDDVPQLMQGVADWISNAKREGMPAEQIAAGAYQRIVSVHPFINGNGRTARLVMDWVLQAEGLPLPAIEFRRFAIFVGQPGPAGQSSNPSMSAELITDGLNKTVELYEQALGIKQ